MELKFNNPDTKAVYDKLLAAVGGVERRRSEYDMEESLREVAYIGQRFCRSFRIDGHNRFCYENFIRWCHADTEMLAVDPATSRPTAGRPDAGIFIAGAPGVGKSTAVNVMRYYAKAHGVKITFPGLGGGGLEQNIWWEPVRADRVCDEYAMKGNIVDYKRRRILAVDDLGGEPRESLYMGNRLDVIRQLLETRGDDTSLITIVTSNYALAMPELADRYGDRVVSRLRGMTNYYEILGGDRR